VFEGIDCLKQSIKRKAAEPLWI